MSKKILIIEDNRDLAQLLKSHLQDLAFQVDLSFDGITGLAKADSDNYDLVILDLMLPGLDGMEICQRLRRKSAYVPILMLTAKSSEMDRVVGLEVGADDYVTKPFSIRELLARVKAIFRRVDELTDGAKEDLPVVIRTGDLVIEPGAHMVTLAGESLDLAPREFDLLYALALNAGQVVSIDDLLAQVWGAEYEGETQAVYVHIRWLREKIESDPQKPQRIVTVRGVGYKLEALETS